MIEYRNLAFKLFAFLNLSSLEWETNILTLDTYLSSCKC